MSSARTSSRSRLKFRPPKVLICSLLCLLALSMILLVAQLRAIELAPKNAIEDLQQRINDSKINQRPTITAIDQRAILNHGLQNKQPATNDTPVTTRPDHVSINRDDRAGDTDGVIGDSPTASDVLAANNEQSPSLRRLDAGGSIEPAATITSPILVEAATSQQAGLPATGETQVVAQVSEIAPVDHERLMQQAAAQLLASVNQPAGLQHAPDLNTIGLQRGGPTLAELTAAGTAAGLLMHDLVAQANMVEQLPMNQPGVWAGDDSDDGSEPTPGGLESTASDQEGQWGGQLPAGSPEEQMQAQQARERQREADEGEEEAEEGARVAPRNRRPMMKADDADEEQPQAQLRTAANHHHQAIPTAEPESGGAPVPADENQTPDSIESLMGDDLAAAMDDSQDGSSAADPRAGEQAAGGPDEGDTEQHLAGTNLHAQNNNDLPGLTRDQQLLTAARPDLSSDAGQPAEDDDDDSDADEGPQQQRRPSPSSAQQEQEQNAATPSPLHSAMLQRRADEISLQALGAHTSRGPPILAAGNGLVSRARERGFDHNIVAPMRDSIVDLNAAAGHYYGKKKKKVKKVKKVKKKKKIIIKKKKKKIKYKKYKVVKIKKKKKVKKHHHHKKGHHGHGKYYMYAKVPKKKAWEFGFKKGNKKHWISRHEKGYKNKFKTKVKWYDKKSKGKGFHVWDYNHHDKKKKKHHYG